MRDYEKALGAAYIAICSAAAGALGDDEKREILSRLLRLFSVSTRLKPSDVLKKAGYSNFDHAFKNLNS